MVSSPSDASGDFPPPKSALKASQHARASMVFGLAIASAAYLVAMRHVLLAFIAHPHSVPLGANGDQAFYLWAVERGISSQSFKQYMTECEWSRATCVSLAAVPQEWRSFYLMGRLAHMLRVGTPEFLSVYYYSALFANVIAAFFLIARISFNPVVSGLLAGVVGFQQSLVWRIQGHLALIAVWPLLLAMLALVGMVDTVFKDASGRKFLGNLVLFCAAVLVTVLTSYHYFLFGLILIPSLLIAILLSRSTRGGRNFHPLRPSSLAVAFLVLLVTGFSAGWILWPALPSHQAPSRAESYERTAEDVVRCSTRWLDYAEPTRLSGAVTVYEAFGLELKTSDVKDRWPWELHGFLGATFWAAVLISVASLLVPTLRKPEARSPSCLVGSVVFTALAVGTAFLGTAPGGSILHAVVNGLRCFNRFSPFVVLFGACAIALVWAPRPRGKMAITAVLGLLFVAEFWQQPILRRDLVKTLDAEERQAGEMRSLCAGGLLSVAPHVSDFMFGPYRLFYIAQLARCPLDGISGPTTVPSPTLMRPLRGTVIWGPQSTGFEHIVLESHPTTEPVP